MGDALAVVFVADRPVVVVNAFELYPPNIEGNCDEGKPGTGGEIAEGKQDTELMGSFGFID